MQDQAFTAHGLYSVGNSASLDNLGHNCAITNTTCIQAVVNAFKNKPYCLTWQLVGELNAQLQDKPSYTTAAAAVRAADPMRLITEVGVGGTNPAASTYQGAPLDDAVVVESTLFGGGIPQSLNHFFDNAGVVAGNLSYTNSPNFIRAISGTPYQELSGGGAASAFTVLPSDHTLRWFWLCVAVGMKWIEELWAPSQRQSFLAQNLSVASKVTLVSNGADTRQVKITGNIGGVLSTETITLNGTTAVTTVNTYDSGGFGSALPDSTNARTVTVTQTTGGATLGTINGPAGDGGVYANGDLGLPYGVLATYQQILGIFANIRSIEQVILAPGTWTACGSNHPGSYRSGFGQTGVLSVKKSYGGNLYVIAINIDSGGDSVFTDTAVNGVTIDVGQTINSATRLFGTGSGGTSFSGSVITENFPAMATRIWQIT